MEKNPKPPQIFCLKWPWDTHHQTNNNTKTPSPCDFDTPWIFKSIQTIGKLSSNLINNSPLKPIIDNFHNMGTPQNSKFNHPNAKNSSVSSDKKKNGGRLSGEEQAEAEQRAFACALASGKEATVIEFYSPKCSLCNSLLGFVNEVENKNSDWLNLVMADAENDKWLPEAVNVASAELLAIREGLFIARENNFNNIEAETDALQICNLLKSNDVCSTHPLKAIIDDICLLIEDKIVTFLHTKRDCTTRLLTPWSYLLCISSRPRPSCLVP